jgi:hypothetical protein
MTCRQLMESAKLLLRNYTNFSGQADKADKGEILHCVQNDQPLVILRSDSDEVSLLVY